MISHTDTCMCSDSTAATIVVSATIEPTDRSMPPDTITNVMPIATISRNALSTSRSSSTCHEKKPVYITEPKPNSAQNSRTVTAIGSVRGSITRASASRKRVIVPPRAI
ncbi:hypothetical protein OKW32_005998 [Paraburkholderia youngii]